MHTEFLHHIVTVYVRNCHNMEKEKKLPWSFAWEKKIEALDEITDFVHEMLSVCAPLEDRSREAKLTVKSVYRHPKCFKLSENLWTYFSDESKK